jgi:hypothetical protein
VKEGLAGEVLLYLEYQKQNTRVTKVGQTDNIPPVVVAKVVSEFDMVLLFGDRGVGASCCFERGQCRTLGLVVKC